MEEKLLHDLHVHQLLDPSKIHFKLRFRKILKWSEIKIPAQVSEQNTSEKK